MEKKDINYQYQQFLGSLLREKPKIKQNKVLCECETEYTPMESSY